MKRLHSRICGLLVIFLILPLSQCLSRHVDYGGTLPPLMVRGQLTSSQGESVAGKAILLLAPHFMGWEDAARDMVAGRVEFETKRYNAIKVQTDANGKFECLFPKIFRLVGGKETFFPVHHYAGAAPDEWNRIQVLVTLADAPGDFVLIRHFNSETCVFYLESHDEGFVKRPEAKRSFGVDAEIVRQSDADSMTLRLILSDR